MGCGYIIDGVPAGCPAYDPAIGGMNVAEIAQPRFADVPESLLDGSTIAIGDHYYPDANGFSMLGFNCITSFTGKLTSLALGTIVTLTIEGTNDEALTDWAPCTELFIFNDGTIGNASFSVENSITIYGMHLNPSEPFPYYWCRPKLVIAGSINNAATIKMLRKAK